MIPIIKVCVSALVSVLSVILFLRFRGSERKLCMLGMIFSTLGDVFMTDILHIGDFSTYPGAAFFILAHIVYALCFIKAGNRQGHKLVDKGFWAGLTLTLAAAALLTVMMIERTGKMQGMYLPILAYLAFIGLNVVSQFSYGFFKKGRFLFLPLGMTLFLASDFLVFLPMLNVRGESVAYNMVIWILYIPAQLMIVLFNSDKKETTE